MGKERGRGGGRGVEGTFVGRDAACLEAPQTILVLVNGMETVTVLLVSSSSSSSRSSESETLLQHDSHFCSPFTSTNLLRLCFPQ